MPNGGSGNCGNCVNNMLRGAQVPYVGYCRIHQVCISNPYWTTCNNLFRWELTLEGWKELKQRLQTNSNDNDVHPQSDVHYNIETDSSIDDEVLYETGTHQPLEHFQTLEELSEDPRLRENAAVIRLCIELLKLESNPQERIVRIEEFAVSKKPFVLLTAANDIRHLVRQRVGNNCLLRAFRSVLSGLGDDKVFHYYHNEFDTVCSTLYLSWIELPPRFAKCLADWPDWSALLANEDLRTRYHQLYAPDVLQSPVGADSHKDFEATYKYGTPESEIARIEKVTQQNIRRRHRLIAIFEYEALKTILPVLDSHPE